MNPTYKETLLVIGIGALSTGIERMDVNITVGVILVLVGVGVIAFRGWLKTE